MSQTFIVGAQIIARHVCDLVALCFDRGNDAMLNFVQQEIVRSGNILLAATRSLGIKV
jgi:hypothetical protein